MCSMVESIRKSTSIIPRILPNQAHHDLPLSQPHSTTQGEQVGGGSGGSGGSLRRRIMSSLSLRIQPISHPSSSSWSFRRSKSMSSIGDQAGNSIKKWWEWGWSWITSRKPVFAQDLEMNEEEIRVLGGLQNRGSWRHVLYKVRSEIRKIVRSDDVGLPQTIK
ncbi:uncharacterized protein LOC104415921 [Eucalyptus grandis]|uniref:Uncharacterized protein n=2 Tax=Eucalyptus grandis TaxID=71139 RepID=A0ACC3K5I1_EUCGR|nr:uncharacterized protein LOC104415921 [Eucalyptus grandis]KAK3421212.1 hypothetical protein EUGRSUZ_H04995 [Eucalyptus grandis]